MGFLRRKVPTHYIPIHPHNVSNKDWIILLEAGTIVGPSAEKLRVAEATLEKRIVKRYNLFLQPKHYLVLEGYDPRIHTLYFCPSSTGSMMKTSSSALRARKSADWWRKPSRTG